jgi:hypothetical protein
LQEKQSRIDYAQSAAKKLTSHPNFIVSTEARQLSLRRELDQCLTQMWESSKNAVQELWSFIIQREEAVELTLRSALPRLKA